MVSKAAERSGSVSALTLPASIDARISLWILSRAVTVKGNFPYADWYGLDMQTGMDWICLDYLCVNLVVSPQLPQVP